MRLELQTSVQFIHNNSVINNYEMPWTELTNNQSCWPRAIIAIIKRNTILPKRSGAVISLTVMFRIKFTWQSRMSLACVEGKKYWNTVKHLRRLLAVGGRAELSFYPHSVMIYFQGKFCCDFRVLFTLGSNGLEVSFPSIGKNCHGDGWNSNQDRDEFSGDESVWPRMNYTQTPGPFYINAHKQSKTLFTQRKVN